MQLWDTHVRRMHTTLQTIDTKQTCYSLLFTLLYFPSLPNALVLFIVNSTGDALLYAAILYGAMLCDAMWCNVFSSLKM